MTPARCVCAIYSGFSGSVGILRKRDMCGPATAKYATTGPAADRVGSSVSRDIRRGISKASPFPPERSACAIYLEFSELCENVASLARGIFDPCPAADCVGFSGNHEITRRPSEISPLSLMMVLRRLLRFVGLFRNSPKTVPTWRLWGNMRPTGPRSIA